MSTLKKIISSNCTWLSNIRLVNKHACRAWRFGANGAYVPGLFRTPRLRTQARPGMNVDKCKAARGMRLDVNMTMFTWHFAEWRITCLAAGATWMCYNAKSNCLPNINPSSTTVNSLNSFPIHTPNSAKMKNIAIIATFCCAAAFGKG